ncbi:hypothetical protein KY290_035766 [Solanum tuberosum]|uniref:Uncharacterized protein n=1 Tax=Solanum tuberosum TaxID=4113 RepID=A0ABQ7TRE5_SOLTU|nr:hypothetical protein KY290_035766 [Solanum tuberosum]
MSLFKLYPGKQADTQGKFETKHPRDPLRVWSYKKAEKILEFYHFLQRSILPRFPGTVINVQDEIEVVVDSNSTNVPITEYIKQAANENSNYIIRCSVKHPPLRCMVKSRS